MVAIGCGWNGCERCSPAQAPVAAAQTHINGTCITYQRGPITEWYINRPIGLEQGFTL